MEHGGKSLGQDVIEAPALIQQAAQFHRLPGQRLIRKRLKRGLEGGDLLDDFIERLDVTVVGRAENGLGEGAEHTKFTKFMKMCDGCGPRACVKRRVAKGGAARAENRMRRQSTKARLTRG